MILTLVYIERLARAYQITVRYLHRRAFLLYFSIIYSHPDVT